MFDKPQRSSPVEKLDKTDAVQSVLEALTKLQYGTIQLTVHQGKIVEIAVTERQRFEN
jgi:hypothetical protein